ncbi:hypothetical protein H0E87_024496 [Populus deltoides]|uniref:UMP-CMP kinase n=1 Tax=Populus deltoides TaxID=3696 RepID=A0A8T2XA45_POPDE|nr:hypothetical protein H0E87_024496 [Populus deltoides]
MATFFVSRLKSERDTSPIASGPQETPPMYELNGLSGEWLPLLLTYTNPKHLNSVTKSITGMAKTEMEAKLFYRKPLVVFVLGGPGSGKGTQCPKIVEHFGFRHLCAGDLLQAEIESESENGKMIQNFKKEGKIVPSEITVKLLQQAMQQSDNKRFIIDGFPRNEENRAAFENIVRIKPEFVLFFDCPEEELTKRILNRNQVTLLHILVAESLPMHLFTTFSVFLKGRVDDNIETIGKRLKVYFETTLPVINYYNSKGKVQKIDAQRSIKEVFEDVKSVFAKLRPVARVGSTK